MVLRDHSGARNRGWLGASSKHRRDVDVAEDRFAVLLACGGLVALERQTKRPAEKKRGLGKVVRVIARVALKMERGRFSVLIEQMEEVG